MNLRVMEKAAHRNVSVSEVVNLKAEDHVRLYKAMCVAGFLPWNLRTFAEEVYREQLGGTISDRALLNWMKNDVVCKAIAAGHDSDMSLEWYKKASAEFSSWDESV